jgi:hypothetical protein
VIFLGWAPKLALKVNTVGSPPTPTKPWVATHTGFKVKVVGSPPTLAQRVLNETLWNPAFF